MSDADLAVVAAEHEAIRTELTAADAVEHLTAYYEIDCDFYS